MKKKMLFLLLIIGILLTGCGKSEEDLSYAKDPEKFVKDSFKEYYKKDIELIEKEEKKDSENEITTIMKFKLKDDESIIFDACSYWQLDSIEFTTHYTYQNNYQNVYEVKLFKEHFENRDDFRLSIDTKEKNVNSVCTYEIHNLTIEIDDLENIPELLDELLTMKEEKEIYAFSTFVKYQDKQISMTINTNTSEEDILKKLNELKTA